MDDVAEAQSGAAQVFYSAVDGFGGSVAGVRVVEVGEDVISAAFHRASQSLEFCEFMGHPGTYRVNDCHQVVFGLGSVGMTVRGHALSW